jgi:diguanylate cyclase (GGDEF)-like protein/PAS domain S-box-containing protein
MSRQKSVVKNKAEVALDEQIFHRVFDEHSAIMMLIDPRSGGILDANRAAVKFYGHSRTKLRGMTIDQINTLPPGQAEAERQKVINREQNIFISSHCLATGEERVVEVHSSPVTLQRKRVLFSIIHDITDRNRADEELRKSEDRYRTLFDNMMDGIYRSTHEGRFVDVNPAMVKMFGYASREEMLAVDIKKDLYFAPEERGSHVLDTGQEETEVYRMRRKDGSEIWVEDHGHYIHDEQGNILYHEGMLRDVTLRKHSEEELRQTKDALEVAHRELGQAFLREQELARIDTLTGIYNRRYLFEIAEREFNFSSRYRAPLSALMFDVDDFKSINDNLGHAVGDRALQSLTQAVRAQLRAVDVLGRYGGDEFMILLPQTRAAEAYIVSERIHTSIANLRIGTGKGSLSLTISLGIAETTNTAGLSDSVESLFLRADQALYAAKQAGRNCTVIFGAK